MLHAYDGTGQDQPPPYNATINLISNSSIVLVDGYSPYSATANNGARFLLNVDLEVVIDGVSYKFDYGQTMFIDKSQQLDKFLSTVSSTTLTSLIPGTSTMGKSGSLSSRPGLPLVAMLVVGTVIYILHWGDRGIVIYLSGNAPTFSKGSALDTYSLIVQSGQVCWNLDDNDYLALSKGMEHYLELKSAEASCWHI